MKIHSQSYDCGHSCCLRVENLSVKIGTEHILKDVNLHVHCGQMVALIGPNGAGKSTFLRTVLGYCRSVCTVLGTRRQTDH